MSEDEATPQAGRLICADWLPFYSKRPALAVLADFGHEGMWGVVQNWPDDRAVKDRVYFFDGPMAERRAWRQYYLCQADIARERAERFYGEEG